MQSEGREEGEEGEGRGETEFSKEAREERKGSEVREEGREKEAEWEVRDGVLGRQLREEREERDSTMVKEERERRPSRLSQRLLQPLVTMGRKLSRRSRRQEEQEVSLLEPLLEHTLKIPQDFISEMKEAFCYFDKVRGKDSQEGCTSSSSSTCSTYKSTAVTENIYYPNIRNDIKYQYQ